MFVIYSEPIYSNLFQETLSKSCRFPGLPERHEQRSYSSISRSHRTNGAYGSRTGGTGGGSGVMADSTEGSGNSAEQEVQRHPMSNSEKQTRSFGNRTNSVRKETAKETRNNNISNNLRLPTHEHRRQESKRGKDRLNRRNQDVPWSKTTRYTSVHIPNVDTSEKKWWRFLKWLPGLKNFKFSRSTVPEDHVADESGNPREELSMTLFITNIRDDNEQRPVWEGRSYLLETTTKQTLLHLLTRALSSQNRSLSGKKKKKRYCMLVDHLQNAKLSKFAKPRFKDFVKNEEDWDKRCL